MKVVCINLKGIMDSWVDDTSCLYRPPTITINKVYDLIIEYPNDIRKKTLFRFIDDNNRTRNYLLFKDNFITLEEFISSKRNDKLNELGI